MTDEERQRQSREALERVARDSETLGSSGLSRSAKRAVDHFAGRDAVGRRSCGDAASAAPCR
jgi:hypothetical protein